MFESDDWDLDQDVLNDADDKAIQYFVQNDSQTFQSKRRKIENDNNSAFSSQCDSNTWRNTFKNTAINYNQSKELRKNLILGLLNKNSPGKSVPNSTIETYEDISADNKDQNCQDNQLLGNNLVLGILKNKKIQTNVVENKTKHSDLKKVKSDIKYNRNDNISIQKEYTILSSKVENKTLKNNNEARSISDHYSSKNPRRQLLCDVLKQESIDNTKSKNNNLNSILPTIRLVQVQPNEKMTLVRKFPGPAGLLPDDINFNIPCVSYLSSLEESEKAKEDPSSKNLSEYCSQNTKNLFSEGAWQNMLDDLPSGFLKGCDIATVKQTATLNGFNGTKVKFLAGIVEHIDFSHDNPPIVLKDFTDSIQGIIHRDIPLKYPGILEANVVLLLHDVGLLRTSGVFVLNKYQILISPSNLLAIYTSKGIIEHTEQLQSVFRYISEGKMKEEEDYSQLLKTDPSSKSYQLIPKNNNNSKEQINFKDIEVDSNKKEIDNVTNNLFDFDADINVPLLPIKVTNSLTQLNCINSVSKYPKYLKPGKKMRSFEPFLIEEKNRKDDKEIENLLESSLSAKRCLHPNVTKTLETDAGQSGSRSTHSRDGSKSLNRVSIENMHSDKSDALISIKGIKSTTEVMHDNNTASIDFQLQQFKSVNAPNILKDFVIEKDKKVPEEKPSETLNSVQNIASINDNDSDDEIFSQLDMDTIFTNYNKAS